MRRWLLAVAGGAFLFVIAAAGFHRHDDVRASDDCAVCLAATQTQRHAPADAPSICRSCAAVALPQAATPAPAARRPSRARSRGPPRA
ncbi:MAG: hypothetical protein PHF00_06100 [Elusimicrobia bacterium]|nr:hypothetical protein [Elusimicrobiota bacterium]